MGMPYQAEAFLYSGRYVAGSAGLQNYVMIAARMGLASSRELVEHSEQLRHQVRRGTCRHKYGPNGQLKSVNVTEKIHFAYHILTLVHCVCI